MSNFEFPYQLIIRYSVRFVDGNKKQQELEIDRDVYMVLEESRLAEKKQRNVYERHTEFSELSEATLNERQLHPAKTVDDLVFENLQSEALHGVINGLPEIQRRRFWLHYNDGFTYAKIASLEGDTCTRDAVCRSVAIAKAKIIEAMWQYRG